MKTLELKQMEEITGTGPGRDCLVDGIWVVAGIATILVGGWSILAYAIGDAAKNDCFSDKQI